MHTELFVKRGENVIYIRTSANWFKRFKNDISIKNASDAAAVEEENDGKYFD